MKRDEKDLEEMKRVLDHQFEVLTFHKKLCSIDNTRDYRELLQQKSQVVDLLKRKIEKYVKQEAIITRVLDTINDDSKKQVLEESESKINKKLNEVKIIKEIKKNTLQKY